MTDRRPEVEVSIHGNSVSLRIVTTTIYATKVYKRTMELAGKKGVEEPVVTPIADGMERISVDVAPLDAALGYLARLTDLEGVPVDAAMRRIKAFKDAEA